MPASGERLSAESKAKLSRSLRERFASPEARAKLSQAQRARRLRERERVVAQPDRKRCVKCAEVKDVGEFYSKRRKLKAGGELLYPDSRCKECRKHEAKERYRQAVEKHGLAAVTRRRKAQEDPRRRRRYRREYSTAKRREKGVAPRNFKKPRSETGPRVATEPIAVFVEGRLEKEDKALLAARTGLDERRFFGLVRREYDSVSLATVDAILTGLDCPEELNNLYPPEPEKLVGYHVLDENGKPIQ